MLFAGMGTEVFVFFLSAFDRPFDKTAIGMDLPTHLYDEEENDEEAEGQHDSNACTAATAGGATVVGAPVGGTIIIGGGATAGNATANDADSSVNGADSSANAAAQAGTGSGATLVSNVPSWVEAQQQVSPELAEAQGNYVEELKKLTEMLQKVSEQSARLTRDSEEMENLNRTLTGICKVYEMQLKSASQQIGTIDQINDQSRRMAQQIEQLNSIYARMIEAMTVNMKGVNPGA